jgi:hypothetical protein
MHLGDAATRDLYAGLGPTERARLLARLNREDHPDEIDRLRRSTPQEQASTYNRCIDVLGELHGPLPPLLGLIAYRAQRNQLALSIAMLVRLLRLERLHVLFDVWTLVAYPITESEYRGLIGQERAEPWSLDDFALHICDTYGEEDAAGLCEAMAAWMRDVPEDTTEDEARQQVRALLDAAVRRGELPKPKRTKGGPSLPWGMLSDWLERRELSDYRPRDPGYHVPTLELLGALNATWEVRPDGEAEAVRARREQIVTTLARAARIPMECLTTPHPPRSRAERERAEREAERAWPWSPSGEVLDGAREFGRRHAGIRGELAAVEEVLDKIRDEEFGGEDPLSPELHAMLEQARRDVADFAPMWEQAGGVFGGDGPWPQEPEGDAETREALAAMLKGRLQGQ